ncbi:MAG: hypothetical protein QE487_12920 [Fluviicola sp.]|nr:hypothetical protein [Fluviicola sp.]
MKKLLILLCIAVLSTTTIVGQDKGYYGKKAFVEITGLGAIPMINNLDADYGYYVKSGTTITSGKDKFNTGFNVNIGITLNPQNALSFSAGYSYFNIEGPTNLYYYEPQYNSYMAIPVKFENLKVRSLVLMPIIQFSTKRHAMLPVGFSHELGFGIVRSKVVDNDYRYTGNANQDGSFYHNGTSKDVIEFMDSVSTVNGDLINYDQVYKGFIVMYGLNMRTPISKQLAIHYGLRYTLNLAANNQWYDYNGPISSYESALNDQLANSIRITRLRSIISLQLGLTYLF